VGGRVTTRHRCPCRTLGDRPVLDPKDAAPSLVNRRGHLSADRQVGPAVRLSKKKKVSFDDWVALENDLLGRLASGENPARVLDAKPFPKLSGSTWKHEAREMMEDGVDETRFGSALSWFAQAVRSETGLGRKRLDDLVWGDAFDRAEARSPVPGDPDAIIADWIADEIWGLEWAFEGHFGLARVELATRLAVCQDVRKRLERAGRRPDRAAAEAVAVVDLVGDSEWWTDIVSKMRI